MKYLFSKIWFFGFILSIILTSCSSQTSLAQRAKSNQVRKSKKIEVKKASDSSIAEIQQPITKSNPLESDIIFESHLPMPQREFRGAWIASVANINWPSDKNLSTEQQKQEAIALLDLLVDNNFNAVIFQVRPSADALYQSPYEPWSYYLTGQIGKTPNPYYDPLSFWIEEAHKRGLEFHVWLNPYRVHHSNGGNVTSESMAKKMNDVVVRLKNGMYWFDPADKKTQDHASKIIKDIVSRYDIDALHFDDYFYPYKSYNGGKDFPDDKSWNNYKNNGGKLSREDWRRQQVNLFVERIHKEIKEVKPFVKFGISPFGIWKPGYPHGVTGMSQYDELYADAKLWLNKGWVDYFAPQLYWPINSKGQNYEDLLEWWQEENTQQIHLWPGINTVDVKVSNRPEEIVNQIYIARKKLPKSNGVIHWSIGGLTKSQAMQNALKKGPYKEKALIPKTPWLRKFSLHQPTFLYKDTSINIEIDWSKSSKENVFSWILYTEYDGEWNIELLPFGTQMKHLGKYKDHKKLNTVVLKSVDRLGNESAYFAKKLNF